jgi:hypothetical protein
VSAVGDSHDSHLDEIALAEELDGVGDRASIAARAEHLARCAECRDALAELRRVVQDPAVRGELDRPEWRARVQHRLPVRRTAAKVALGALAAAAVLLIASRIDAGRTATHDEKQVLRHATLTVSAAPRLIAPVGSVNRVDSLRWTSVPRADLYRVTVFDASGAVLWEAEASDTNIGVPAEVAAKWAGALRWRVKARTSFDRWVDSEFGTFDVGNAR